MPLSCSGGIRNTSTGGHCSIDVRGAPALSAAACAAAVSFLLEEEVAVECDDSYLGGLRLQLHLL